ncbi:hypothetical protein [Mycoplasma sp. 125]|uniref:hypothetical protein n=1 Tax=Mycoplasma sp. 125 TaxID=3447505 RepID=UPI003F65A640
MKKSNKILLTLASISIPFITAATVISCSSNNDNKPSNPKIEDQKKPEDPKKKEEGKEQEKKPEDPKKNEEGKEQEKKPEINGKTEPENKDPKDDGKNNDSKKENNKNNEHLGKTLPDGKTEDEDGEDTLTSPALPKPEPTPEEDDLINNLDEEEVKEIEKNEVLVFQGLFKKSFEDLQKQVLEEDLKKLITDLPEQIKKNIPKFDDKIKLGELKLTPESKESKEKNS